MNENVYSDQEIIITPSCNKELSLAVKGAVALFFVKIAIVMPFGAIYSSLMLYMTHQLQMTDSAASRVVASSLAYMGVVRMLMGWIAGRYISFANLLCLSIIAMIFGCLLICIPSTFYWGMCAIIMSGGGMLAVNCLLTQLFQSDHDRREAAFLWNYTGIQIGNMLGFLLGGYCQLRQHYLQLFIISCLFSFTGLMIVIVNWKNVTLNNAINRQKINTKNSFRYLMKLILLLCFIFPLNWLLTHVNTGDFFILLGCLILFLYIYSQGRRQSCVETKNRMNLYLFLSIPTVLFWTFNYLAPVAMTLFVERHVDRRLFGQIISPQWVQMISSLAIVLGGPLLSLFLINARKHKLQIGFLTQYAFALFVSSISVGMLCIGISFSSQTGMVTFKWVILSYLLQGFAELFIGPLGYSMVSQAAPVNMRGIMMAGWLMLMSVGAIFAGYLSEHLLGSNQANMLAVKTVYLHNFISLSGLMLLATLGIIMIGSGLTS